MSHQIMKLENELTVSLTKLNLESVLPENVSTNKFIQLAAMSVMNNEYVAGLVENKKVDMSYMANQLILCARDGLTLDGREATLIPFFNKKKGVHDLTYIPMVAGLKKRVLQSGEVVSIRSFIVYQHESFKHIRDNKGEHWTHEPDYDQESPVKYAVAAATDRYGNEYIEVANVARINKSMMSSSSFNSKSSPWVKNYDRMAEIVPLRRLCKKLPNSSELVNLIERGVEQRVEIIEKEVNKHNEASVKRIENKRNYKSMSFGDVSEEIEGVSSRSEKQHLLMLKDRCQELAKSGELSSDEICLLKSKLKSAISRIS